MSKKNLYIYTSLSLQPDLYINILGQCFEKFGSTAFEEIFLLRITRGNNSIEDEYKELKKIRSNLIEQLGNLANSKYLKWSKQEQEFEDRDNPLEAHVNERFQSIYKQILHKLTSIGELNIRVIEYADLESSLHFLVGRRSIECLFDLTGIPKRDFLDISLILLSLHSTIYIFEMERKFSYDHEDFIHSLCEDDFNYISLNKPEFLIEKKSSFSLEENKENWRLLIAKSNMNEVFESIQSYFFSRDFKSTQESQVFTMASSRYHQLSLDKRFGIGDDTTHNQELNQIKKTVLELIEGLE